LVFGYWEDEDGGAQPDNPYVKRGAAARQQSEAYKAADRWTKQQEDIWYLIWD